MTKRESVYATCDCGRWLGSIESRHALAWRNEHKLLRNDVIDWHLPDALDISKDPNWNQFSENWTKLNSLEHETQNGKQQHWMILIFDTFDESPWKMMNFGAARQHERQKSAESVCNLSSLTVEIDDHLALKSISFSLIFRPAGN